MNIHTKPSPDPSFDPFSLVGRNGKDANILFELVMKEKAERSLVEFTKQAWDIIEPGQAYTHGWHIDFMAAHLEAITDGVRINGSPYNRLLINVPPGHMKSMLLMLWSCWEWGPRNMPHLRYICASHSIDIAIRDNQRARRLIESEWYQKHWGDRVKLHKDQNMKSKFENVHGGFRQAVAAGGITGLRGDRVLIDDPMSVDGAASEAVRESTNTWFLEALPTRLNSPINSAIIVIMQRLHEEDTSGVILEHNLGYDHVMLPLEYDPDRAFATKLGFEDPRQTSGEILFPERFPPSVVERDKKALGPYAVAGQFQQIPAPRGGGIIKREYWINWTEDKFPGFDYIMAAVDTAYTLKKENDYSAMTVWGVFTGNPYAVATKIIRRDGTLVDASREVDMRVYDEQRPRLMLIHAWQERLPFHELVEKIAETCRDLHIDKVLVEGKASGISVEQELRRLYGHETWGVQIHNPGAYDKVARLTSVEPIFAEGMVYAPDRKWADMVIDQCASFPKTKHDDLVDTVSMAVRHLRDLGMLVRGAEWTSNIQGSMQFTGNSNNEPLYPA